MIRRIALQIRVPGNLPSVVQSIHGTKHASERAEVKHLAVLPQENILCRLPSRRIDGVVGEGDPSHLSPVVVQKSHAVCTLAQCLEILYRSVSPNRSVHLSGRWRNE